MRTLGERLPMGDLLRVERRYGGGESLRESGIDGGGEL